MHQLQLHVKQEAIYPPLMFVLHALQVPQQLVKNLVKVPVSHLLVQLVLLVLQVPPQHVLQDVKVKDLKLLEQRVLHALQVPPNVTLQLSPPSAHQEPSYLQLEYVPHVPLPMQTLLPVNPKLLQLVAPMDITSFKLHVKLVKLKQHVLLLVKLLDISLVELESILHVLHVPLVQVLVPMLRMLLLALQDTIYKESFV